MVDAVGSAAKASVNAVPSWIDHAADSAIERHDFIAGQMRTPTISGGKFDPEADATLLWQSMRGKVGEDRKPVLDLMWDRTPGQIRAIDMIYNDRFDSKLSDDTRNELGPQQAKIVERLRNGDRIGAASAHLVDATSQHRDKNEIPAVLKRLDASAFQAVVRLHGERLKAADGELRDHWKDRPEQLERLAQMAIMLERLSHVQLPGDPGLALLSADYCELLGDLAQQN